MCSWNSRLDLKMKRAAPAPVIGCARLISRRYDLRLDFDEMKFRFIDDENLGLDVDRLVNQIVSRTNQCTVTRPELRRMIENEMATSAVTSSRFSVFAIRPVISFCRANRSLMSRRSAVPMWDRTPAASTPAQTLMWDRSTRRRSTKARSWQNGLDDR